MTNHTSMSIALPLRRRRASSTRGETGLRAAVALASSIASLSVGCGDPGLETTSVAQAIELDAVEDAKACVVAIAEANTLRTDNIEAVRRRLSPYVDLLSDFFARARRFDEVELTQGSWKSIWYDDDDIQDRDFFSLDRNAIYQVVEPGYYYNVANNHILLFGHPIGKAHSFLKGNYRIIRPANSSNQGEARLNVIDLEFDDNKLRFGPVAEDEPLRTIVRRVERGTVGSIPVPGPKGITGELWNLYIDRDLRIAAGIQDDNQVQDLYILRRVTWAGPLPPYSDRTPESCD